MITGAISESNGVVIISFEKHSEYCSWLRLVWMRWWIENSSSSVNRVHNNKNFLDIGKVNSLINTISDCKEFNFGGHNIDSMM